MDNIVPCIKPITLLFTPSETIITDKDIFLREPYLRIDMVPNNSLDNLRTMNISYRNVNTYSEHIEEEEFFERISQCLIGDEDKLVRKAAQYMYSLSEEEIIIITKEYSKYICEGGAILDGLIAGIGAYFSFLLLNENRLFGQEVIFDIPYNILGDIVICSNMMKYLYLPLTALSGLENPILSGLITFVKSFINIWEPLFIDGDEINSTTQTKLAIDIISGLSSHVINKSLATPNLEKITNGLKADITNLVEETRETVLNITSNTSPNYIKTMIEVECREAIANIMNSEMIPSLNLIQVQLKEEFCRLEMERSQLQDMEQRIKRLEQLYLEKQVTNIAPVINNDFLPLCTVKPTNKNNTFCLKDII